MFLGAKNDARGFSRAGFSRSLARADSSLNAFRMYPLDHPKSILARFYSAYLSLICSISLYGVDNVERVSPFPYTLDISHHEVRCGTKVSRDIARGVWGDDSARMGEERRPVGKWFRIRHVECDAVQAAFWVIERCEDILRMRQVSTTNINEDSVFRKHFEVL